MLEQHKWEIDKYMSELEQNKIQSNRLLESQVMYLQKKVEQMEEDKEKIINE